MEVTINIGYDNRIAMRCSILDGDLANSSIDLVKMLLDQAMEELSEVIPTSCSGYKSRLKYNGEDCGYVEMIR